MTSTLTKRYLTPGDPIAFSGINNIQREVGKISRNQLTNVLRGIDTYTRHKFSKKPLRNPFFSYFPRYQWQIDLVDIRKHSSKNQNFNYLLTCIDIFTRLGFAEPIKSKNSKDFLKGFKQILKKVKKYPKTILADRGSEIKNQDFKKFCEQNKIKLLFTSNFEHCAYVERFNLSLKNLIYKYMTANGTKSFIKVLPNLLKTYNNRFHRSIRMTPNEAEKKQNLFKVRQAQELKYSKIERQLPKFKIGDTVRISKLKTVFSRGFTAKFKDEIFKILKINTILPLPTYQLETLNEGEPIEGNFYEAELTPVKSDDVYEVETILKERTVRGQRQLLVKWVGYKKPTWIPKSSLIED